jgi:hypothetical protein
MERSVSIMLAVLQLAAKQDSSWDGPQTTFADSPIVNPEPPMELGDDQVSLGSPGPLE